MGMGVLWHDVGIPHRSKRVDGQHYSTRAELASVVIALHRIPCADDPAILFDSATAIQRLWLFQSHNLQLAEPKIKDYDIIQEA